MDQTHQPRQNCAQTLKDEIKQLQGLAPFLGSRPTVIVSISLSIKSKTVTRRVQFKQDQIGFVGKQINKNLRKKYPLPP